MKINRKINVLNETKLESIEQLDRLVEIDHSGHILKEMASLLLQAMNDWDTSNQTRILDFVDEFERYFGKPISKEEIKSKIMNSTGSDGWKHESASSIMELINLGELHFGQSDIRECVDLILKHYHVENETDYNRAVDKLFKGVGNKHNVVCPPKQVFAKVNIDFLFTIGGDLFDNSNEYDRFRTLLKDIGETRFYVVENLGATQTSRKHPFKTIVDLNEDYNIFREKTMTFDPPFGWRINHFYVYGDSGTWGIYIAEYPTINIIGCNEELSDRFRQAFTISGNGYGQVQELVEKEFESNKSGLSEFLDNYAANL